MCRDGDPHQHPELGLLTTVCQSEAPESAVAIRGDHYLYYNGHGDLAAEADGSGTRTALHTYDPFGEPLDTPPANSTSHRFTGRWNKQTDSTSSLVLMGARPYDPSLGRFLAVDPVDGGSINNYDYAGQDPINGYDLAGLYEESGQVVEGGDAGEDGGSGESESDAIRDQALKGALTEEEDATYENVISNGNKMGHIFDPKHELDGLVSALGGEANVVRQVVMNLGKIGSQEGDCIKSNGEYSILRTVAGVTLRITGKIMSNGAVKLGNFWVPT